ncbi:MULTISPECIES: LPS translocon maturation chaperone LptM [Chelatococcus]|nr:MULTISPECIES: lipoprotein [Chelatococcus]
MGLSPLLNHLMGALVRAGGEIQTVATHEDVADERRWRIAASATRLHHRRRLGLALRDPSAIVRAVFPENAFVPSPLPTARSLAVVLAVALALAACGRRGALELPPDPNAPAQEEKTSTGGASLTPSPVGTPKKQPVAQPRPNEPFFLDAIL